MPQHSSKTSVERDKDKARMTNDESNPKSECRRKRATDALFGFQGFGLYSSFKPAWRRACRRLNFAHEAPSAADTGGRFSLAVSVQAHQVQSCGTVTSQFRHHFHRRPGVSGRGLFWFAE